ncbi:hypothetical protein EJ03DRAFT_373513 [Teratosphaeria nubilosa]|uniref:Uncharacterized protein n=1 Tax=Teratosphaeria nubilosa TaxID=161662 RepID=A0A6G1LDD4_9PEZI|nr:hypothetical protein EJ03DRAFT_373513 [Teratosphaeria nubilosa]
MAHTELTGLSIDNAAPLAKRITQGSNSIQAAAPHDKPFRFFDLPRELRDKIYALSKCLLFNCTPHKGHDYSPPACFSCPEFCAFRLVLVSRASKQEYEEEVYRTAVFTITIPMISKPQACLFTHDFVTILAKARTVVAELDTAVFYKHESGFDAETVTMGVKGTPKTNQNDEETALEADYEYMVARAADNDEWDYEYDDEFELDYDDEFELEFDD